MIRRWMIALVLVPVVWAASPAQETPRPSPTPETGLPVTVGRAPQTLPWGYEAGSADKPRVRLKDLATLAGVNTHTLTGYGLVAGLPGTGDSSTALSSPMLANMLQRMGMREIEASTVAQARARNVALVAVTAELPPFARSGDPVDVTVSSLGDAKSLNGGTLLLSLLRGPDAKVYGSAQGRVFDGSPINQAGGGASKGPAVGTILRGATVSRNLESPAFGRSKLVWVLHRPDLTTASRVAATITYTLQLPARAMGPQTVEVDVAGQDPVLAAAAMSEMYVEEDRPALIVVDRQTGTIVAGQDVRLRAATISTRGITIEIPAGTTIQEIAATLGEMGVVLTPEDLAGILKAMRDSGSLTGEVVIR